MIQETRIQPLNRNPVRKGRYVLYWMQASQRAECNHALEYAVERANEARVPLLVYFGITGRYPRATERHYVFMLEGLREVHSGLKERGIRMVVQCVSPERGVEDASRDACLVVADRGYQRLQKAWRRSAAHAIRCPLIQVESDVIVPVEVASPKEEYAASTFRPKIKKRLEEYLVPLKPKRLKNGSLHLRMKSFDLSDVPRAIARLTIDRRVKPAPFFRGGAGEAKKRLRGFLRNRLDEYPDRRNDPTQDALSGMSPYLHFGQISPLTIASAVRAAGSTGGDAYLEELIVRRELSMNFVHYNTRYDSLEALPAWALRTLREHARDRREHVYRLKHLEHARTHDPYWNAAQEEMLLTGKMHGYMRMYWGKKILEWAPTADDALRWAILLNDRYELDGRDPNGYAGVLWCFGKHDRPWQTRKVLGSVRYMSAGGLSRKFDPDAYVEKIRRIKEAGAIDG